MTKKPKRSKETTRSSKRTLVAAKPAKKTKVATKSAPVVPAATPATEPTATPVTRSKAARAHIAEGTRLFALAGRPTKAQFVTEYGAKGPTMTWAQRAKAGVDAKHIQEALKAKSWC